MHHFLASILIFSVFAITNALDAKDVGLYHNKAFELLGAKYETTAPTSKVDVMANIADILSSFCEDPALELQLDSNCKKKAYEMTMKGFHKNEKGPQKIDFPFDYDPTLRRSLEMIEPTLSELDENNFDEVLNTLTEIQNEIISAEDVNQVHKVVAISGSSIAIESLKLWYGAFTEPNHYLHNFISPQKQRHRNLQSLTITLDFSRINAIVNADVSGALRGAFESLALIPFLVFYPPAFPLIALYTGTIASAAEGANGAATDDTTDGTDNRDTANGN